MDQSDQSNQTNGYDPSCKTDVSTNKNLKLIPIQIDEFHPQESSKIFLIPEAKRNIIPKKLNDYEEYYDISSLGGSKKRQRMKGKKMPI